tara:strand:+ start:1254 stop:1682 length:429 start_codon:yes stop_codon:yes gene_type:complete
MSLGTYAPGEVSINVAGHIVSGYTESSFVDIEFGNDRITMEKGADGEVARVITEDDSAMITIRLQQTSPSNDVFSALFDADIITKAGAFVIGVKDNLGSTTFLCDAAWITKLPSVSFSNGIEQREWAIQCGSLKAAHVGGNQ